MAHLPHQSPFFGQSDDDDDEGQQRPQSNLLPYTLSDPDDDDFQGVPGVEVLQGVKGGGWQAGGSWSSNRWQQHQHQGSSPWQAGGSDWSQSGNDNQHWRQHGGQKQAREINCSNCRLQNKP